MGRVDEAAAVGVVEEAARGVTIREDEEVPVMSLWTILLIILIVAVILFVFSRIR